MNSPEMNVQSFIVRIWLEDSDKKTGSAVWRGSITHVPSGKRVYIQETNEIPPFINRYLEEMGVQVSFFSKILHWLGFQKKTRNTHI